MKNKPKIYTGLLQDLKDHSKRDAAIRDIAIIIAGMFRVNLNPLPHLRKILPQVTWEAITPLGLKGKAREKYRNASERSDLTFYVHDSDMQTVVIFGRADGVTLDRVIWNDAVLCQILPDYNPVEAAKA